MATLPATFKAWLDTDDGQQFLRTLLEINWEARAIEDRCRRREKIATRVLMAFGLLLIVGSLACLFI